MLKSPIVEHKKYLFQVFFKVQHFHPIRNIIKVSNEIKLNGKSVYTKLRHAKNTQIAQRL